VAHYGCGQQKPHIFDKQIGVNMNKERAFPMTWVKQEAPNLNVILEQRGMTLRDYFAAKAMQALIDNDGLFSEIPTQAYELADAMLKARGV
jgi:short-subunit dehydrogenase involved in D-alanine esterification of teichoic acids